MIIRKYFIVITTILEFSFPIARANWHDYIPTMQLWLAFIPPVRRPNFIRFMNYAFRVNRQKRMHQLRVHPAFFNVKPSFTPSYKTR